MIKKSDIRISAFGERLIYNKSYSPDIVFNIIQEYHLNGLRVAAHLKEDRLENLDFLKDYTFLEALDITVVEDYDYSFLSSLKNLKELSISGEGNNEINFEGLQNLLKLTIHWRKNRIKGLDLCQNLRMLYLVNFNERNLMAVSKLSVLKDLYIKSSSISTIDGIEFLKSLEKVQFGNCKKLYSIGRLNGLLKLKTIEIISCPRIEDYNNLNSLPSIERLELTDCKSIKSIGFVENFTTLKELSILGNTNIQDGNLSFTLFIPKVIYGKRPHYFT